MISASTKIKNSLKEYAKSSENLSALNPFEIHVIILDTALGNWRSYLIYLTEEISKQVWQIKSDNIVQVTHRSNSQIRF